LLGWIGQTCVGWIGEKRRFVICIVIVPLFDQSLIMIYLNDLHWCFGIGIGLSCDGTELWWSFQVGSHVPHLQRRSQLRLARNHPLWPWGSFDIIPRKFFSTNKSRLGIFYYWIFVELSWIKCSSRRARHLIQLRILLPPRKGSGVFHCPPKQLVLEICTGCMFLGSCSRNSNQKVEPRNPPSFCSGNQVEMPACWV